MELDLYSLFSYIGCLALVFILISNYEKTASRRNKFWLIASYLCIVLFCGLRFYVGNDYANYVNGYYTIKDWDGLNIYLWEPAYYLLNLIFLDCYGGYVYVMAISSAITYFFLYKALKDRNILRWGLFYTFTLGLLIFCNDVIRQGVALSIFIYSLKYIEKARFSKYLICILGASMFHFSAIILLLVYFVRRIKIPYYIWMVLLVLVFVLQYTGIMRSIFLSILSSIPYYNTYIDKADKYVVDVSPGLGILYNFLIALMIAFAYRKYRPDTIITIYLIGSLLYVASVGIALFERIAFYLMYTNIIVFANFMFIPRYRQISRVFAFITLIYFSIQSLTGLEKHGAVPYRTLLNEDLENPPTEYLPEEEN